MLKGIIKLSMNGIEISVLLLAFNRKDYVKFAIDSLGSQTLPSSKFEVIYISNFDNYDDYFLKKIENGQIFHPENPKWGHWLYLGITNSRGKIITILEDDDLYAKIRLERIYNIFKLYNNDCIFYTNNYVLGLANNLPELISNDYKIHYFKEYNKKAFTELLNKNIFFNNSRTAITKRNWIDNLNLIRNADVENSDTFIASLAYESKCKIIVDDAPLTFIRNTSNSLSKPSLNYLNKAFEMSDFILNNIAKSEELRVYIKLGKLYSNYLTHKLHKMTCKKEKLTSKDVKLLLEIKEIKALYLILFNMVFCKG